MKGLYPAVFRQLCYLVSILQFISDFLLYLIFIIIYSLMLIFFLPILLPSAGWEHSWFFPPFILFQHGKTIK